jgi:nucleoside-diphosphate-sugar epimerase
MSANGLSRSRITVLGGSGFIGAKLIARFRELGQDVIIGDIRESKEFPDIYRYCDVRDDSTMTGVLEGSDALVNLAAEHRDDVHPISRYHETNVEGAKQVCSAARTAGIQTIIFTSSVAVYGFQPFPVKEDGPFEPFNPYGETKLLAESEYISWANEDPNRRLVILRPTVVFGEGNRGNVYNLLRQIASKRFLMVGSGENRKSMAYVYNVVDALVYALNCPPGIEIFNYVDSPDLTMNELVTIVLESLGRSNSIKTHVPVPMAMIGARVLDLLSRVTGKSFPISAIRVKKFIESTRFSSDKLISHGFKPRFSLREGLSRTIRSEF